MRNLIVRILRWTAEVATDQAEKLSKCGQCGGNPYYDPPCYGKAEDYDRKFGRKDID